MVVDKMSLGLVEDGGHRTFYPKLILGASQVAQLVKNPPAMQETQIQSLSLENPLEKVMATHSSILAWRRTWIEEPGGLQRVKFQRVRHDGVTNTFTFHPYV